MAFSRPKYHQNNATDRSLRGAECEFDVDRENDAPLLNRQLMDQFVIHSAMMQVVFDMFDPDFRFNITEPDLY
jgi:hypothetical protein